jgi:hypothetical protein
MNRNRFFWGILIILLGFMLLLNTFGILTINAWKIFWPLVLILIGTWFLIRPLFHRSGHQAESITIPLENATSLRLKVKHGAGRLHIGSEPINSQTALSGTFFDGVDYDTHLDGGEMKIKLKAPSESYLDFFSASGFEGLIWDVNVNRDLPLALEVNSGASETNLDLTDLKIKELEISTGASNTQVILPASAGYTHAKINSGAASVNIRVPDGVAGRFNIRHGMAGIHVDTLRFPFVGNAYETPGFSTASNRIEMNIETGVGSVEIR